MAQTLKSSQRLLATLNQTSRYYNARPTLLTSSPARNHTTGFSITFADGPLESILTKPAGVDAENKEGLEDSVESASRSAKDTPGKKSKHAKSVQTAVDTQKTDVSPRGRKAPTVRSSRPRHQQTAQIQQAAYSVQGQGEPEELPQVVHDEEDLRRDYPDTRTIDDAGRSHAQRDQQDMIVEASSPAKSQKPLSAYKETWQVQKAALKQKFGGEGWNPRKKVSPDTMEGIRALHAQYPEQYTTPVLAQQFGVSAEAIRRILKSKWSSNVEPEILAEKRERWAKRHDRIWDIKSELGLRPRRRGAKEVEDPDQFEEELRGKQLLEAYRDA